jgi:apolipoprotein N-acyltransferase
MSKAFSGSFIPLRTAVAGVRLNPSIPPSQRALDYARRMEKLFWLIGATVGGWLGWWLGEQMGIMAAVILSAVGTGVGIYLAHRIINDYF